MSLENIETSSTPEIGENALNPESLENNANESNSAENAEASEGQPQDNGGEKKDEGGNEPQKQAKPPVDNREDSKLGRKVKKLEDTVSTLVGKIDEYISTQVKGQEEIQELDLSDIDDNEMLNKDKVVKLANRIFEHNEKIREKKRNKDAYDNFLKKSSYSKNYINVLDSFSETVEPELYTQTRNLINANIQNNSKEFNEAWTGNPETDAKINFINAQNAILSKTVKIQKTPFANPANINGTGVNVKSKSETPNQKAKVKLDGIAAEAASAFGLTEDEVNDAINSSSYTPTSGGKRGI